MLINPNDSIVLVQHYPRALIALMSSYDVSQEDMLLGTGIDPALFKQQGATISYSQYGVLILNAVRAFPGESLGLEFGKALHIMEHGMLGVAVISSNTLRDALSIMEKYYKLLSPIVTLTFSENGNQCLVKANEAWNIGPLQALAIETFFSGLYETCESVLGQRVPAQFYFRHEKPAYLHLYEECFGDQCHFECASDQILFDKEWLDQPLKWSSPTTCEQALAICDAQLNEIAGRESLLGKLMLLPLIENGEVLALDDAASYLNMSGRSLRRHLSLLKTSYQQVIDKVRSEMAEELLKGDEYTVTEIAEQLGYSDVANFRKAFKRWLGRTPSEFRKILEK